jgi:hypothetical protein
MVLVRGSEEPALEQPALITRGVVLSCMPVLHRQYSSRGLSSPVPDVKHRSGLRPDAVMKGQNVQRSRRKDLVKWIHASFSSVHP